jgi:uncharacterized protein YjiS (DUF1127 family)
MVTYLNYFVVAFYNGIDTMFSSIDKGLRARRAYEELNRLNDRELHDLGLNRYDITRVAFESVQSKSF